MLSDRLWRAQGARRQKYAHQCASAAPRRLCKQIESGLLKVRFEEPEVLIEFARQCREQIAGDCITEIIGFLHRGAQRVGMMRNVVHQKLQH